VTAPAELLAEIEGRAAAVELSWDIAPPGAAFVAEHRADNRKMASALRAVLAMCDEAQERDTATLRAGGSQIVRHLSSNVHADLIQRAIATALSASEAGK